MFPNLKTHALKPTLKAFSQYLVTFANTNKLKIDVKDLFSYADDIKFKIKDEYTEDDIKKIEKYCRKDTYYTHILIKYLCSIARPEDINCAIIDSTVSYLFAKATVEGIPL
ncbi:MAG: hypothetical protein GTN87_04305, partial [Hydrotalea flava]|nr:hypothetical protein [Hydrotalea flava]